MSWVSDVVDHAWFAERENEYLRWYPKSLTAISTATGPTLRRLPIRGAYIHVPFCDQICKFCPFHKRVTDPHQVERYVAALLNEIDLYADTLSGGQLEFIYFGGGTPSVLTAHQIGAIVARLRSAFRQVDGGEVSIEMHPSHAKPDTIAEFMAVGVNRFSLGIQSFDDGHLRQLGAVHDAATAHAALSAFARAGANCAIDLLYRYPGQDSAEWQRELRTAVEDYGVRHLSCYSLVEVGTPNPATPPVQEDIALAVQALTYAEDIGFSHYASCASGGFDVCRPGFEGVYEQRHWQAPQAAFIALGPGAIGFAGGHTTVNFLNLDRYCQRIAAGRLPLISATPVDEEEMRRRYFALGVKAIHIPFTPYRERFGSEPLRDFAVEIDGLVAQRLATVDADGLTLSRIGRLFVDSCSTIFYSASERDVPHPEEPQFRRLERQVDRVAG